MIRMFKMEPKGLCDNFRMQRQFYLLIEHKQSCSSLCSANGLILHLLHISFWQELRLKKPKPSAFFFYSIVTVNTADIEEKYDPMWGPMRLFSR